MSRVEYAKHRGVSRESVRKAIRDGRIREDARGIEWVVADAAWTATARPAADPPADGPRAAATSPAPPDRAPRVPAGVPAGRFELTFANARAMNEYTKAQLNQLELDRQTGRVLDAELLLDELSSRLRAAFDLLHSIPDRVGDKLAVVSDPDEVRSILRTELEVVSAELEGAGNVPDAVAKEQVS